MKRYIIILMILFASANLNAQNLQTLQDFYKKFKTTQFQQGIINQQDEVEGSPHEKENFEIGTVITKSEIVYENVPLRFNIYSNDVEFKTEDGTIFFLASPEIIDHVLIGQDKYIYAPYALGNRMLRGYFKVLSEGKVSLLLKLNMNLKQAELPQAYKEAQPARFIRSMDEFFIRIPPSEAHKFTNKKELTSILNDKTTEIEGFIKKNKTRFNKQDEIKELVDYYNSLQ
jgi:hypothetical protein